MPNEWCFFPVQLDTMVIVILSYEPLISLHVQTCAWLAVPDTDSHMTYSSDIDSCMTSSKKYGFLETACSCSLSHCLHYSCMSWTYDKDDVTLHCSTHLRHSATGTTSAVLPSVIPLAVKMVTLLRPISTSLGTWATTGDRQEASGEYTNLS